MSFCMDFQQQLPKEVLIGKEESCIHLKKALSQPSSVKWSAFGRKISLVDFKVFVPFPSLLYFNKCASYKSREIPELKEASPLK